MNLHLTIENITKLAELIASKCGVPMAEAMLLAEFNLQYADSYQQAVKRIY